jgi:hypothetical protein
MKRIMPLVAVVFLSTLSANSDIENLSISTKRLAEAVDILSRTQVKGVEEQKAVKDSIKEVLYKQNEIESSIRKNSERIARLESAKDAPRSIVKEVFVEPAKREKTQQTVVIKPTEDTGVSEIVEYIKSDSRVGSLQNVTSVKKSDIERY